MNDTISIRGIVATEPRHLVTESGHEITSLRLASPSRRWDRATSSWTNGDTNWYTVTAFRSLARNIKKSVNKGDRVIVCGRLRIRNWERPDRSGTSVEIDADTLGHDLAWGQGTWMRVPRVTSDESAGPGEAPASSEQARDQAAAAATAETDASVAAGELPSSMADPDRDPVDVGGGSAPTSTALTADRSAADEAAPRTPF